MKHWTRWSILVSFQTFMTLAALLSALFCFLGLVEAPVDRPAAAGYACLWALVCLLAFWFSRRWLPLTLLALASLYGAAVYLRLRDLVRGAVSLGCQLSAVYAEALGLTRYYPLEQLEAEQALRCVNLFLALVLAPAALAVVWAVVRRRSFFWLFALTCPTVLASVVLPRTPPTLPLLVLVSCWLVMALAAGGGRYGPLSAAKAGWLAVPAAAVLLLLVSLWIPMDGSYRRSALGEQARLWLYGLGQEETGGRAEAAGPAPEPATGQSRLDTAGDLHFQGYTALRFYSEQPGKTYLRGFSAEKYNGVSWRQAYETDYNNALQGADFDPMNLLADTIQLNFPDQGAYQVILDQVCPKGSYLYAPYGLMTPTEQLEGAYRVRDSYLLLRSDSLHSSYRLKVSQLPVLEQAPQLSAMPGQVEAGYSRFIQENCLQIPEELQPLLEQIAGQQGLPHVSESPWYEVADQVTAYLRQWARYDPAPGTLPPGKDYVEYFLTESRVGYCMHFASASVLLLRSRGIPARYVEGYLVNKEDFGPDGWAEVKDSRAHAWAEVYVEGAGWVPVDSTPAYGGGPLEPEPEQPEPQPEAEQEQPEQPEQPQPQVRPEQPEPESRTFGRGIRLPRWARMTAAAGVLLLALAVRPALARRHRRRLFETGQPNRRALAVYRYAQRLKPYVSGQQQLEQIEQLGLKARFSAQGLEAEQADQASRLAYALARQVWQQSKWPRRLALRWLRALL